MLAKLKVCKSEPHSHSVETYVCRCSACRSDRSLRRQLEAVASLKLNSAELHQSQTSLSPVDASVVIKCPLILIRFTKPFSTSGGQQKGKVKGDNGSGRSDTGNGRHGRDNSGSTILCPCCGHPCTKTQIFMCKLSSPAIST